MRRGVTFTTPKCSDRVPVLERMLIGLDIVSRSWVEGVTQGLKCRARHLQQFFFHLNPNSHLIQLK